MLLAPKSPLRLMRRTTRRVAGTSRRTGRRSSSPKAPSTVSGPSNRHSGADYDEGATVKRGSLVGARGPVAPQVVPLHRFVRGHFVTVQIGADDRDFRQRFAEGSHVRKREVLLEVLA
jgi:hypothetical protein